MSISLKVQTDLQADQTAVYSVESPEKFDQRGLSQPEITYLRQRYENKKTITMLNRYTHQIYVVCPEQNDKPTPAYKRLESYRCMGYEILQNLKAEKTEAITIQFYPNLKAEGLALIEGLLLSAYQFLRYKLDAEKEKIKLHTIHVIGDALEQSDLDEITHLVEGTFFARDLVNEPSNFLTATQLAIEIEKAGKDAGFGVEIFQKAKIESLGMTGLLTVNAGSIEPPTFTVMEYKPANAQNTEPIILVGKGVVFDTGGLSLKPTPQSMDYMKCDMGGAAMVAGAMYAIAKNKLPLYIVALIPATDNRPGENAMAPSDVIKMMNGKTIEIMNADAEGRMILADALCYAERYKPQLVIDAATLTGASMRALSDAAASIMGNAGAEITQKVIKAGEEVYERLVEFPLWDEYGEHLKSDTADIKNVGKPEGGHISAGKFLEHFVSFPWLHIDIAGIAYIHAPNKYRGKNGTGYGVRLLYQFLKNY